MKKAPPPAHYVILEAIALILIPFLFLAPQATINQLLLLVTTVSPAIKLVMGVTKVRAVKQNNLNVL